MKSAKAVPTKRKKTRRKKRRRFQNRERPTIRFTPYSWSKLLYLRDAGDTEIGGFALSSADALLRVEDFRLIKQTCTPVTVEFDDEAVADFFDEQVDAGLKPEQFGRIWIHTHPGSSAQPSRTDETTFARCFGNADWAVMFILAKGGDTYCRLQFNVGPKASQQIEVEIDFEITFPATDHDAWQAEYETNVSQPPRRCHGQTELQALYDDIDDDLRPFLDGESPWPEAFWPDFDEPVSRENLCRNSAHA